MRKGLSIYSFDQNVPLEVISEAHSLLDEQGISIVGSIDIKGLYHNDRTLESHLETEVLLEGSKIKDFRCTCQVFIEDKICSHILAMLLSIQKEKKLSRPTARSTSQRQELTRSRLSEILEPLSKEELVDFIKSYAATNRDFYLSLKTTFIQQLPHTQSDHDLKDLVRSLIKHIQANSSKWTIRKADKLLKYAEQLTLRIKESITLGDLTGAVHSLKILADLVLPICYKNEELEPFKQLAGLIITLLKNLAKKEKAPELAIEMEKIIEGILEAKWYIPWREADNLLFFWKNTPIEGNPYDVYKEKLAQSIGDRERQAVLMAGIVFIFSHPKIGPIPLPKDPWSLVQWNIFLSSLKLESTISSSAQNIKMVYQKLISDSIKVLAIQDLLGKLTKAKDQKPFLDNIATAILQSGNQELFTLIAPELHRELLDQLLLQSEEIRDFRISGQFALFSNQYDKVLSLFKSSTAINCTIGLTDALKIPDIQLQLGSISEQLINFLKSYYGNKNMEKLTELIQILELKKCNPEVKALKTSILKAIPDRSLLKASLSGKVIDL